MKFVFGIFTFFFVLIFCNLLVGIGSGAIGANPVWLFPDWLVLICAFGGFYVVVK